MAVRILAITIVAACGMTAFGQGVNPANSPTDTTHVLQSVRPFPDELTTWASSIGTSASPVSVELDPAGPVWVKHFQTQTGEPITRMGTSIRLLETLVVGGSTEWSGWHTELPSGFQWPTSTGFFPPPPIEATVSGVPLPLTYTVSGTSLDSILPPAMPGTQVTFRFAFFWTDPTPLSAPFEIREYPTPEPTTVTVLLFAALLLARRNL